MSASVRGLLAKQIADRRTLVYETRGTEVYALRKINRSSLKEEVEIRVISPDGGISRMFDVTMIGDMDPERVFRELIRCSGLTLNDIKKLSKNIQIKHDEIKKSVSEDAGLEDVFGLVYVLLEDQKKTLDEIKETDTNLDKSILLKDGCYMMKAGVFKRLADEIEVNSTDLRKELVSLGFIEVGNDREAASVSVWGRKQRLIRVRRDLMKRIFETADVLDEVSGE